MPDDIDSLCKLFEAEISKSNDADKKLLLESVQMIYYKKTFAVKYDEIEQHICAILKLCHSKEKAHVPFSIPKSNSFESTGHIQAVVFDFDGTLTTTKPRTTWESLWEILGYNVQECRNLHREYDDGKFSHQEWCNKTAEKFIEKELTQRQIIELSKKIKLIPGCKETLQELRKRNLKMYIVSGSIKEIIERVLGSVHCYFTEIKANEFIFDTQTLILKKIIETEYDFAGKAEYINQIANKLQISTSDILFVGNSNNDDWAYKSGAITLCINPTHTNYHNQNIWQHYIVECKNLSEILPFVK